MTLEVPGCEINLLLSIAFGSNGAMPYFLKVFLMLEKVREFSKALKKIAENWFLTLSKPGHSSSNDKAFVLTDQRDQCFYAVELVR